MSERIQALGFSISSTDADRAKLLGALIDFAKATHNKDLEAEALELMPKANPFMPPLEWREQYDAGFSDTADESTGTYVDDMYGYGTEYWQNLSDQQRQLRLQKPGIGLSDGVKDAETLNGVDLSEVSENESGTD